jgi:anthranilate phosphoribosyltransferase
VLSFTPPVVGSGGSIPPRRVGGTAAVILVSHDKEINVTLTKRTYTPIKSDEEVTDYQVEADEIERPPTGDTPEEALRVFAQLLENDGEDNRSLDFEELAEEPDDDWIEA